MNAFKFMDHEYQKPIAVDDWIPEEQDIIFKTCKNTLVLPVSNYFGVDNDKLDRFILSTKRCYNGQKMQQHLPHYMNYFEKFYDTDKELLITIFKFKYMIDYQSEYNQEMFINDLRRYILSDSLMIKAHMMNEDNYCLDLDKKNYRNNRNPCLQYSDKHGKILMWMSLVINMMIPLITHYCYVNNVVDVNIFLLKIYDVIFKYVMATTYVNMYSKLCETTLSNVDKNSRDNSTIWDMQNIRGENVNLHSNSSTNNIILNIIPKYVYNNNIIFLNYTSIRNSTGFQITEISFEYDFVPLSGSKRDADQSSEFDKWESFLIRQNEALYLQNKVNSQQTMSTIDHLFGPFNKNEIDYYKKRLADEDGNIVNGFQKSLVGYLFYKFFGDPISLYAINKDDYVKLIITAKNMLLKANMIILPYIISGKIERLQFRKSVNKREFTKLIDDELYDKIEAKYDDEKIMKQIMSIVATILASDFRIIDFYDDNIDGRLISNIPDLITKELRMFITMI